MHGDEDLTGLDGLGEKRRGVNRGAPGSHFDLLLRANAEPTCVSRIDLHVDVLGIQLAQHGALGGAGLRVPLRGGAASGEEEKRIPGIGDFRRFTWLLEDELRPAVGVKETAILEETTFGIGFCVLGFEF